MSQKATILIVDDEPDLREVLEEYFVAQGYIALCAENAEKARGLAAKHPVDIALLDIAMPGEDGLSLARYLRERYARLAIVLLTSAGTVVDRIVGLEIGADDYVTKPFDPRELLARVKSVLRRTSAAFSAEVGAERVRIGRCVLDRTAHKLTDEDGREVSMSPLEFILLKALSDHPDRVLTRERILNLSGQDDWDPLDRSVDLRILRLRKKIEPDPEHPQYIRTVRSEGYKFIPGGFEEKLNASPCVAKRPLLFIALLVSMFAAGGCMREPDPPLRVGTNVWIGSEPLYLARDLGKLDRDVVQLVEYPSASEVSRAFRNQAIDAMVISLDELFVLAMGGLQPKVVLAVDVSHGADVVVGRAGMRTMKDLRGKRVAVESGALGAFVLSRALTLNGMKASDVSIVHLESNEHPAAFKQGSVDGAVTFDPYRSQLIGLGAQAIFDSSQIPGEIVDLLAVRTSVLEKNPKAVQATLTGWFQALDYLQRNPKDAAARMAVREQITGEQFLQALHGLRFPSRAENLKMLAGEKPGLAVSGRQLMTLMVEAKLLRDTLDIDGLLAPGTLQKLPP